MYKKCPRCEEIKDFSMFYKSKRLKQGVQSYCKQCHTELDNLARQRRIDHGPTIFRDSKICKICNNKKPISQFGLRTNSADGKLSYCKPCWTEYVKKAKKKQKMV
jgi:hypothetical protein